MTYRYTEHDLLLPQKEYSIGNFFHFDEFFVLTEDSVKIECWSLTQAGAEFNLFFLPGNSWNLRHRIPAFNEIGKRLKANLFSVNYRGYGLSEGAPSLAGILKDGEAAMRFFNENPAIHRGLPTVLVGFSLGTFVALHLGNDEAVGGIVLLSPMTCTREIIKYGKRSRIPFYASPFIKVKVDSNLAGLDNCALVRKIRKPILFIHGQKDSVLSCEMSNTLFRLCPSRFKKRILLTGAGHFLCDETSIDSVADEINQFRLECGVLYASPENQ
jgi:pimeloyl-ACP methyl ester carboxylesterase